MIRECTAEDAERICLVVNEAAEKAYKGVIPSDCWHEPYMPLDEVRREMAEMRFFGWDAEGGQDARPRRNLIGVMGYQPLGEVTLVRHAYVLSTRQGEGIGGKLLDYLVGYPPEAGRRRPDQDGFARRVRSPAATLPSSGRLLVGTWKVNAGAIRFYERRGFRRLGDEESQELLRRYWRISERQRETSLVLGVDLQ